MIEKYIITYCMSQHDTNLCLESTIICIVNIKCFYLNANINVNNIYNNISNNILHSVFGFSNYLLHATASIFMSQVSYSGIIFHNLLCVMIITLFLHSVRAFFSKQYYLQTSIVMTVNLASLSIHSI